MKRTLFFTLLLVLATTLFAYANDRHIVVVIPSYNNQNFCVKNLETLFSQDYKNFSVVYVDDCSSDATAALVERYRNENNLHDRLLLVKNNIRGGALRNIYMAIHCYCNDDDIVVIYDGDDFLANDHALTIINQAYENPNTWITYGNFSSTKNGVPDWCQPFDERVIKNGSYRKSAWRFGHPRTFYAWLFKKINLHDLLHEGAFYEMSQDQAWAHPLLEMAHGRCTFIRHILYTYNEHNPINDWTLNRTLQHRLRDVILAKKPYQPLSEKPTKRMQQPSLCTVYLSYDNPQELQTYLKKHHASAPAFVLWKSSLEHQKNYESLIEEYPAYVFTKQGKALQTAHDICLCFDTTSNKTLPDSILSDIKLLQQTNTALVAYATYEQNVGTPRPLLHSSYLWDSKFTFQLGWKPELPYAHQEYAWLVPTEALNKNISHFTYIFSQRSSTISYAKEIQQHAGLLIITN